MVDVKASLNQTYHSEYFLDSFLKFLHHLHYFLYGHMVTWNPTQKVSGHKVSKIDNIGQKVSIQNYLNKNNEHYNFFLIILLTVC